MEPNFCICFPFWETDSAHTCTIHPKQTLVEPRSPSLNFQVLVTASHSLGDYLTTKASHDHAAMLSHCHDTLLAFYNHTILQPHCHTTWLLLDLTAIASHYVTSALPCCLTTTQPYHHAATLIYFIIYMVSYNHSVATDGETLKTSVFYDWHCKLMHIWTQFAVNDHNKTRNMCVKPNKTIQIK